MSKIKNMLAWGGACIATVLMVASAALVSGNAEASTKISLSEKNLVVLRGEVSSESVAKLSQQIIASEEKEIYLYISSPGGSILAGESLIYAMRTSGKKINCIVSVGISMAFAIAQGCDKRYVMPHSIMMQHVASYGIQGQDPNNRSMFKFTTEMIEELDRAQAKRLNMPLSEFKAKTRDDWWMYGENSVKNGAADAVAEVSCSRELAQKTYKEKIRVFIFTVDVEWSACPLIESPLKVELAESKNIAPSKKEHSKIQNVIKNLNTYEIVDARFRKSSNNSK